MKKLFTITLILFSLNSFASDFKKSRIELDDAPISIAESLQGHKIKYVTKYTDQDKHFISVYSSIGMLEKENRRLLGLPFGFGVVLTSLIWLSIAL